MSPFATSRQVHIIMGGEWNDPEEMFIKITGERGKGRVGGLYFMSGFVLSSFVLSGAGGFSFLRAE